MAKTDVPVSVEDPVHNSARISVGPSGWRPLAPPEGADEAGQDAARRAKEELERRLQSALGAERLVVLAGLGTSLGIKAHDGTAIAPGMHDLWDAVAQIEDFDKALALVPEAAASKDIELLLSRCQFALGLGQDEGLKPFTDAAQKEIVRLCRFVDDATDLTTHESFLRTVARRSTRLPRTQFFTTNYDLAFEQAAARARFRLVDGFTLTEPRRFDGGSFDIDFVRRRIGDRPTFEPNVAQLLKLHGSVDWDGSSGHIERRENAVDPVLIYPAQAKFQLSYELPYLECMARFQMALREPDVGLIIVGFGFRDEHIAGPIASALRSNVGMRLVVAAPDLENSKNAHVAFMRELVGRGDRRLTLFAGTFTELTQVLPDLAPKDEREEHESRVDSALGVVEA